MTDFIQNLLITCLLLPATALAGDYSEQSLKSLFTSVQERQGIESDRRGNSTSEAQVLAGPSSVQINGIMKRSDGKNVVWVNGKNTMDSSTVDGIKIYSNSINLKNKIPVMIDERMIYVKPGESWSEGTGVSGVGD